MAEIRRVLIAYDVPQDRRRTKLAKLLSGYGDRVQFSVFVADLSPTRLGRLRRAIEDMIDTWEDSVLLCDLGSSAGVETHRFQYIGQQRPITTSESFVV